jgi:quinoprotein glucose dehydrogenase
MNWSSGAFDPEHQIFVTNVNILPMEVHLIRRDRYQAVEKAAKAGQFRAEVSPQHGTPYGMSRQLLRSPSGAPCNPPPWGALVAVDLADGTIRWNVPLGTAADLLPNLASIPPGSPNLGGPVITAGGLVFIASAMDDYLRAFDIDTGAELWKGRLPAGGQSPQVATASWAPSSVIRWSRSRCPSATAARDGIPRSRRSRLAANDDETA